MFIDKSHQLYYALDISMVRMIGYTRTAALKLLDIELAAMCGLTTKGIDKFREMVQLTPSEDLAILEANLEESISDHVLRQKAWGENPASNQDLQRKPLLECHGPERGGWHLEEEERAHESKSVMLEALQVFRLKVEYDQTRNNEKKNDTTILNQKHHTPILVQVLIPVFSLIFSYQFGKLIMNVTKNLQRPK